MLAGLISKHLFLCDGSLFMALINCFDFVFIIHTIAVQYTLAAIHSQFKLLLPSRVPEPDAGAKRDYDQLLSRLPLQLTTWILLIILRIIP